MTKALAQARRMVAKYEQSIPDNEAWLATCRVHYPNHVVYWERRIANERRYLEQARARVAKAEAWEAKQEQRRRYWENCLANAP